MVACPSPSLSPEASGGQRMDGVLGLPPCRTHKTAQQHPSPEGPPSWLQRPGCQLWAALAWDRLGLQSAARGQGAASHSDPQGLCSAYSPLPPPTGLPNINTGIRLFTRVLGASTSSHVLLGSR